MLQNQSFLIIVFCCFSVNCILFVPTNAFGISDTDNSSYAKLESDINNSNIFLEQISKSLNHTDTIYEKQNNTSEKIVNALQEINKSLNKTNAVLNDLNSGSLTSFDLQQKFENFRFQVGIIAGIESSLIGAATALLGERMIARQIERRRINKTHDLINDDLNRIKNNVNQILVEIPTLLLQLQNTQNIQQEILRNSGAVESNISRLLVNIRLLNWDAIVSGGYLIKLETAEIRHLQNLHNYLEDARRLYLDTYTIHTDNIVKICNAGALPITTLQHITTQLQNLVTFFHSKYPIIIQRINQINSEINWIELKN